MKLHIVVPTIMTNPPVEFSCIKTLDHQFSKLNLDYQIYFVSNFFIEEFDKFKVPSDKVTKLNSNLRFNIARALNFVFENIEINDEDVLGFIQSDVFFENDNWIEPYLEIIATEEYNSGVLGVRPHKSNNVVELLGKYDNKFSLYSSLWNDGTMLFSGKVLKTVGLFDEKFFGDCESKDFCFRAHEAGFINYWMSDDENWFRFKHLTSSFQYKAKVDKSTYLSLVDDSRKYFHKKWEKFEKKYL